MSASFFSFPWAISVRNSEVAHIRSSKVNARQKRKLTIRNFGKEIRGQDHIEHKTRDGKEYMKQLLGALQVTILSCVP